MNNEGMVFDVEKLMDEFTASGLTIDEFVVQQLSSAREDGGEVAQKMLDMFKSIDKNYADLQKAKADGRNRREWLRESLDADFAVLPQNERAEVAGRILTESIDVLNSGKTEMSQPRSFEGLDAVEVVSDLDVALTRDGVAMLANGKPGEGNDK